MVIRTASLMRLRVKVWDATKRIQKEVFLLPNLEFLEVRETGDPRVVSLLCLHYSSHVLCLVSLLALRTVPVQQPTIVDKCHALEVAVFHLLANNCVSLDMLLETWRFWHGSFGHVCVCINISAIGSNQRFFGCGRAPEWHSAPERSVGALTHVMFRRPPHPCPEVLHQRAIWWLDMEAMALMV